MSIGEICTRDTVIATRDSSIIEVARLMREHHVGDIVIVRKEGGENIPVGLVTDRDLVVEVLASGLEPDTVSIGDLVTFEVVTARESDEVWETIARMRAKGVRRMPVVNERGGLVGIVTLDDLLELLADALAALARVPARSQDRERRLRS